MDYAELFHALTTGTTEPVRRWATELLTNIAYGKTDIQAVRHPLGFVCFPVERNAMDGVCFHIWDDRALRATPTTSDIHAHSWDLVSLVLFGEVRNTAFDVVDVADMADIAASPTHRLCEVHTKRGDDEIRTTEREVSLTAVRSDSYGAGSVYSLRAGIFHTSIVDGVAATVALGHGVPDAVDLTAAPLDIRTHVVNRAPCPANEAEHTARLAAGRLGAAA